MSTNPISSQHAPAPTGYAGDLTAQDAWASVQAGDAVLVDVRTAEELHWVGRVPQAIHIAWAHGMQQHPNEQFLAELQAAVPAGGQRVLFLCRSGVRSRKAAGLATTAGYQAWNILDGFEGPHDASRQRGRVAGWQASGLPWQQS